MKEINAIIFAFDRAAAAGLSAALATVVHVEGSAYRRPGARMLISSAGELTGAISGGCLEGDALRKALFVIERKAAMLVTYDTMDDDDAKMGIGMGCNGVIEVLIEPVEPADPLNPVALLKIIAAGVGDAVLATLFSLQQKNGFQAGTCLLQIRNEMLAPGPREAFYYSALVADVEQSRGKKQSFFKDYQPGHNQQTAFIQYIAPPVSLVVFGAGNDVVPLVDIASVFGWKTTVVAGRPEQVSTDKFAPGCWFFQSSDDWQQTVEQGSRVVYLLMTHNFPSDKSFLRDILAMGSEYIGLLGPKTKLIRMIDELEQEGLQITEAQRRNIFGPSGLDIGAETPDEIALSIIAEIQAVLSARSGESLRKKITSIHAREDTLIEAVQVAVKAD